jgi:hypothetical protein
VCKIAYEALPPSLGVRSDFAHAVGLADWLTPEATLDPGQIAAQSAVQKRFFT